MGPPNREASLEPGEPDPGTGCPMLLLPSCSLWVALRMLGLGVLGPFSLGADDAGVEGLLTKMFGD